MTRQGSAARPAYGILHCAILAGCMAVAPLAMASWFALCPQYGDPACPTNANPLSVLAAYRTAPAALVQAFLLVNAAIPYVFPLSYLGLALVAMRRSPWLATLGLACGWCGSVPWGFIADQNVLLSDMARLGNDALFADALTRYFHHPEIYVLAAGWVLGHLLAYVLLGIALARSQAVPRWAAWLIVGAAPLMGPLAYGSGQGAFQVLGFLLVFVGSLPVAAAVFRQPTGGAG